MAEIISFLMIAAAAVVYQVGVVLIFLMHTQMPVTLGLAILRSLLWPVWLVTGWPEGRPEPMD